jgi:hypothetical protein
MKKHWEEPDVANPPAGQYLTRPSYRFPISTLIVAKKFLVGLSSGLPHCSTRLLMRVTTCNWAAP